jgi:RNA polymerase sigma-70 factor (ECF subfamily)
MMSNSQDKRLARRIEAGDHDASCELVHAHHATVYGLLVRLCRHVATAEDLTQETFMTAWTRIGTFNGSASLGTWLHQIAYRKFLDWRRRPRLAGVEHNGADVRSDSWAEPLAEVMADEQSARIERAVDGLEPADREVIVLHYLQGLSLRQMSVVLDQPVGTAKWRVSQALGRLRALLEKGA